MLDSPWGPERQLRAARGVGAAALSCLHDRFQLPQVFPEPGAHIALQRALLDLKRTTWSGSGGYLDCRPVPRASQVKTRVRVQRSGERYESIQLIGGVLRDLKRADYAAADQMAEGAEECPNTAGTR